MAEAVASNPLFRLSDITFFNVGRKVGIPLDPATAISNSIAAFFQFLATPEGQRVVEDFRQLDQAFGAKLKGLFDHISNSIPAGK